MAGEWQSTTVGEVTDRVTKGTTPTTLGGRFVEHGISFVKVESLTEDGRILPDKLAYIDDATDALLRRSRLERDDILFTIAGTIGRAALVPIWLLPANTNQAVAIVRPKREVIDPRFLFYVLRDESRVKHAQTRVVQSVQANFSLGELSSLEIPLPPLPTQRAIASVLGALDDLIDLNRETNEILEEMARALFKSWFVDFDPVRAKLEGRPPAGMDAATAALFPDHFQDSELGQIPKGWEAKPLPDVIEVNPRRTLKAGTIAPYLDMKNLPTRGHSADEVIGREFTSGTKFQNGDTLLARITPCLENGKTGYVDFLDAGQVAWGSTEYIVLLPKPPLPPQFGYLLARSDALRSHAIQNMTGTSGRQRVPSECFNTFLLAVSPDPAVARRFGELTAPLMETIKTNADESRDLATLRDTLLPRLLSREVSVSEPTKRKKMT
jgi:type I restriction enzyme S subunit